ncbi:hypothetical protein [Acidithiobacillus sp. AMEEHan]|uniref:hypothetical protein n=1 Tax=Acidithiobacillus sp. AMEEHan TaxID=2994951 RepID=UPI0027E484A2|nr:hypothetical protein [Acidithiobacillus sp. AMEEHan]
MRIDEFLAKNPYEKSWEEFCASHFADDMYHVWESLTYVPMSDEERLELCIAMMERFLLEKRLVFAEPDIEEWGWHRYEDGLYHIWCADVPTILNYLRGYLPPLSYPYFAEDMETYGSFPMTAWLGWGREKLSWKDYDDRTPMSLWTDGLCIAWPTEWIWTHLDTSPGPVWTPTFLRSDRG